MAHPSTNPTDSFAMPINHYQVFKLHLLLKQSYAREKTITFVSSFLCNKQIMLCIEDIWRKYIRILEVVSEFLTNLRSYKLLHCSCMHIQVHTVVNNRYYWSLNLQLMSKNNRIVCQCSFLLQSLKAKNWHVRLHINDFPFTKIRDTMFYLQIATVLGKYTVKADLSWLSDINR